MLSAGKTSDPHRHRKSERQINSSTLQTLQQHMCTQPQKITFRHKYDEAVDVVIAKLERRFDRSSSSQVVVMEIEQLPLDAANGKQIDEIPTPVN